MRRFLRRRRRRRLSSDPTLRFTPSAWAKLLFLRDRGNTEVGGFGISAVDDLLLLTDVCLVRQTCTATTVAFDDEAVADFFDRQIDRGLPPELVGRVWIHTHPGNSPTPSRTDEETFARVFGRCHWAVMAILAQGGATYARLRFNTGPGGEIHLPVEVDFQQPFGASDRDAWHAEYEANVAPWRPEPLLASADLVPRLDLFDSPWHDLADAELCGHLTNEALAP